MVKLKKYKKGELVVEKEVDRKYYCCGKKVNKNVYELQKLYEETQAKSTKLIPEFFERIRFMIVNGICRATYTKSVDQSGELFNYVAEQLLKKIVPIYDEQTNSLVTKYNPQKTNLGAYILNSCYWSVRMYMNNEQQNMNNLSCAEFFEDYEKVSEVPIIHEIGQFKVISNYDQRDEMIPLIQKILEGRHDEC